jgi:TonB family protein
MKKLAVLMLLILLLGVLRSIAQGQEPTTEIPVGPVNTTAKILPMPQLANARHLKDPGEILVRVKIDFQKGKVLDAHIASGGHPLVNAAVLRAAKGAKFEPALPEFPMVRGLGFIKYTQNDFNKPDLKNEKARGFLIITADELNSRAKILLKPNAVRQGKEYITGRVEVKVLVSAFEGTVVAANAVSGPAELREVSENAAMGVKFTVPYISGGAPIYVKGFIVYTFGKNGKVE